MGRAARDAARSDDPADGFVRAQLLSVYSASRHLGVELSSFDPEVRAFSAGVASAIEMAGASPDLGAPRRRARRDDRSARGGGTRLRAARPAARGRLGSGARSCTSAVRSELVKLTRPRGRAARRRDRGSRRPVTDARAEAVDCGAAGRGRAGRRRPRRGPGAAPRWLVAALVSGRSTRTASDADRRYVVRVKPKGALLDTDLALEYRVHEALAAGGRGHPARLPPRGIGATPPSTGRSSSWSTSRARHRTCTRPRSGPGSRRTGTGRVRSRRTCSATSRASTRCRASASRRSFPSWTSADVVARWRSVYDEKRLVRDPVIEEAYEWLAEHAPAETPRGPRPR